MCAYHRIECGKTKSITASSLRALFFRMVILEKATRKDTFLCTILKWCWHYGCHKFSIPNFSIYIRLHVRKELVLQIPYEGVTHLPYLYIDIVPSTVWPNDVFIVMVMDTYTLLTKGVARIAACQIYVDSRGADLFKL